MYQDRNAHDLVANMKQEYLGNENNLAIVNRLKLNPDAMLEYFPEQSRVAFDLYKKTLPWLSRVDVDLRSS